MSRRVVVLPQPEGPSRQTSVPRSISHRDVIDDGLRPVFLRQPAQLNRRHRKPLDQPSNQQEHRVPVENACVEAPVNTGRRFSMKAVRPSV